MAETNESLLDHNSRSEQSEDNLPINRVQKSWRIFGNPLLSSWGEVLIWRRLASLPYQEYL